MAARYTHKVAPGRSIFSPDGHQHFVAGDVVPEGMLNAKMVEEHVRSGYLLLEPITSGPSAETMSETVPGAEKNAVLSHREDAPVITEDGRAKAPISKWNLDPAGLNGRTLPQLCAMATERNNKVPMSFKTIGEAVAFLSQDFGR